MKTRLLGVSEWVSGRRGGKQRDVGRGIEESER